MNDFAAYTAKTSMRVRVISTNCVWADSTDDELQVEAVGGQPEFPTDAQFIKTRVVFAVLNNKHWDLGVLLTGKRVQAVFREGEWQEAQQLLLEFVGSKAPVRGSVKRQELGPRWAPQISTSPAREKRGVKKESAGRKRACVRRSRPRAVNLSLPFFLLWCEWVRGRQWQEACEREWWCTSLLFCGECVWCEWVRGRQ